MQMVFLIKYTSKPTIKIIAKTKKPHSRITAWVAVYITATITVKYCQNRDFLCEIGVDFIL